MAQGVGQLDIGIGQGAAQVFNPNPAIQQYAQNLAQNKAKHEAEVKQLGDELAKGYDPAGLRNDADRGAYIKQYNDIKQSAIDAENEKDKTKKAFALAQVRQKLSDLGSFSEGSKKQGIFERQLAMEHLKNPYLYNDDTAQKILSGKDKVWNDNGVIKDASEVVRGVDPSKVDADFDKHLKDMVKGGKWQDYKGNQDVIAGKKGQWIYQKRGVPLTGDNGLLENTMHWASSSKDAQKSLQDRYPNIQGNDSQSTLGLRVAKYLHDKGYANGYYEESKPEFKEGYKPQDPVRPSYLEQWNMKHNNGDPNPPSTAQSNTPIYRQAQVDGLLNNDKDAWTQLDAKIKTMPEYQQQGLKVEQDIVGHNGHKLLKITIPEKVEYSANKETGQSTISSKIPEHAVFVDITDKKAGRESMNQIINQLFPGEKVDTQSLETPGGKKHIGTSVSHKKVNDPLGIL